MIAVGKKCWARFVKKWLFKNQPQEVVGLLPLVQPLLEMVLQPTVARALQVEELTTTCALRVEELATARALQVGIVQPPLGTVCGTMHIHSTCRAGVRGWAESQVLWCNAHNVRVGARMAELTVPQLV
jgi:hypothetical protein